jgi:hypothetical protein
VLIFEANVRLSSHLPEDDLLHSKRRLMRSESAMLPQRSLTGCLRKETWQLKSRQVE